MKKLIHVISTIIMLLCINQRMYAQGYCPPTITCTTAAITSVTLNGTTNTSGTVGGYTNYSSPTFSVGSSQTFTISATVNIGFAGSYQLNAWIDYDGSGDWGGVTSELITIAPVQFYGLGTSTKSTTFSVPALAAPGNSRLRVQLRFVVGGGAQNACQSNFCGEVEDYPLTIIALPPLCNSASSNSSGIYISRTDINGITNFSGPGTSSDFVSSITMFPQTNYTLTVDVTNPTNSAQSVYVYGWLDLDGNNVFNTANNEQIVITPSAVSVPSLGSHTFTKVYSFSAPYSSQGAKMRLRASLSSDGVPTPCSTSFTGEIENYTILLPADYCTDVPVQNSVGISSISLNGNSYAVAGTPYSDNTSTIIPVAPNHSYPFSAVTYGGATVAAVYIDYGQNGIFTDAGEAVTLTGPGTYSGTITVPALAAIGNTRMRVVSIFTVGGGLPADCNLNGVNGTVVDYTISIIAAGPPAIACTGDVTVSQDPGVCQAQVIYSTPVCTSNCNGGVITLISGLPSGGNFPIGTTPVHYQLTTPGGTNDCFFNVTVNISPLPAITPVGSTFCAGTSISANSFSSYLWNNGATTQSIIPSSSGTYTVTVTNSTGCTSSISKTVTINPLPNPVISGATTFCPGTSTTLNAGSGFAGYNWSTGATAQSISASADGTYTVTVTNADGCTKSTSATTTVLTHPVPSISGSTSFCQGSTVNLSAQPSGNTYLWSTGSTAQVIGVTTASTYTVTVTFANGCTQSTQVPTIVNPSPAPTISGAASFCPGGSTTLDAGAGYSTYLWSTGANTQTITANSASPFIITVTGSNGCSGSASILTTVNPNPVIAITADGPTTICQGEAVALKASITGNGLQLNGVNQYLITPDLVTAFPSSSMTIELWFNANAAGVIMAELGQPAINSLWHDSQIEILSSGQVKVRVWNLSAVNLGTVSFGTWHHVALRYNSNTAILDGLLDGIPSGTVSGPRLTPVNQYWAFGAIDGTHLGSGAYFSGQLDEIRIWKTALSDAQITQNYQTAIPVNSANLVAYYKLNETSGTTAFDATSNGHNSSLANAPSWIVTSGSDFGANYLWSDGSSINTVNATSSGTYTVTVSNENGCTSSANVTTTVNANPTPSIIGNTSFCSGSSTTLDAGSGYNSYTWSNGATTQTISANTAGTFTVTVTNANGCTGTSTKITTINTVPTVSISGSTSFCSGNSTTLDAGSGYTSYNWSTGETTQIISVNTAGTFIVTVTNANGCTGSANVATTVNANPTPSISGSLSFCSGSSTTLDAGSGYSSYNWSTGATTQTISVNTAGTYTVTVTNANGCTGNDSKTTTVSGSIPTNPSAITVAGGNPKVCPGETRTYTVTNDSGVTYNWTVPVGVSISSGQGTSSINVLFSSNFKNQDTLSVVKVNLCGSSLPKLRVIYRNTPPADITTTGPTTFCSGTNQLTLTANAGAGLTYQWKKGSIDIAGATNQSYVPTKSASSYKVVVTNAVGCTRVSPGVAVTVNTLPAATITAQGPLTFCAGDSVILQANSGAGLNYQWKKGAANIPSATLQNYNAKQAATYKVIVTDINGCSKISAGVKTTINCKEGTDVQEQEVRVYPNPATTSAEIQFDGFAEGKGQLAVYDMIGQQVLKQDVAVATGNNNYKLDLSSLVKGAYMVRVTYNGVVRNCKLIVQ
ncbi:MAG: GEVED domain-containing protein [Bacteroidia bacterium]